MDLIKRQDVLKVLEDTMQTEAKNKPCVFKVLLKLYKAIDDLEAQEAGDDL